MELEEVEARAGREHDEGTQEKLETFERQAEKDAHQRFKKQARKTRGVCGCGFVGCVQQRGKRY